MVFGCMYAAGIRRPDDHLCMVFPPAPVPYSCDMVDNLVECRIDETIELYFRNRLQPINRHPECCPHNSCLAQWCIDNPFAAKLSKQPLCCPEHTAIIANIL